MKTFVIYDNPSDYPGRFVVRTWSIVSGNPEPVPCEKPIAIVHTIEEARRVVPPGLIRCDREAGDDQAIAEVWV